MRKLTVAALAAGLLVFGSVALAQLQQHPHLKAAHEAIATALKHLELANNGKIEFGGHRDRAEQLLKNADSEIDQAARYANEHPAK